MNASGFWRPAADTCNPDQVEPRGSSGTAQNSGGASMRAEAPLRYINSPRQQQTFVRCFVHINIYFFFANVILGEEFNVIQQVLRALCSLSHSISLLVYQPQIDTFMRRSAFTRVKSGFIVGQRVRIIVIRNVTVTTTTFCKPWHRHRIRRTSLR